MSVKIECDHTGEKYLSEIMGEVSLVRDKINLIAAPCGSGKTTYFLKDLVKQGNKMLLLIDTKNGKEMLERTGEKKTRYRYIRGIDEELCRKYEEKYIKYQEEHPDADDRELIENCGTMPYVTFPELIRVEEEYYKVENITIMTYSHFGKLMLLKDEGELYNDDFSPDNYDVIGCDEIQNMIHFKSFGDNAGTYVRCRTELINIIKSGKLVVGISATPDQFTDHFDNKLINKIDFLNRPDIRHYHVVEKIGFRSINHLIKKLPLGMKILIYTDRISSMEKIKNKIDEELWFEYTKIATIFSTNNEKEMDDLSYKVRESIINDGIIPDDIDVVIMNAACETGLNIRSHIDIVIVHSCNKDTIIQVRGRYRNDLWRLYFRQKDSVDIEIPEKYIGIKLDSELKNELVASIDEKDFYNRKVGWTALRKMIIDSGKYTVMDKKSGSKRYSIINLSQP